MDHAMSVMTLYPILLYAVLNSFTPYLFEPMLRYLNKCEGHPTMVRINMIIFMDLSMLD